jgi:hypothetical protein
MGLTNYPNGITSFGSPVMGARHANPWGTHYFVDGTNGNDANDGKSPERSKATIQSAVTASTADTASRGDVIYINPGIWNSGTGFYRYTEDVTITAGSSGTDMTNSNMSLIGISNGGTGDFLGVRWKHATAQSLSNDAPALHVENIGFFNEGATYGVLLTNNGATLTKQGTQGTSFYNCAFKGKGLYAVGGGDGLTVERTRFQCAYDGTVAQLNYNCSANPGRRFTVRNCEWLDGNGTVSSAQMIDVSAPCTEILIRDCYFPQAPTGSVYIDLAGANEGVIANCYFGSANLDTDAHILQGTATIVVACYDVGGLAATT